ncbi:hypothetical protein, partial [uncultured Bacteroides sp.]
MSSSKFSFVPSSMISSTKPYSSASLAVSQRPSFRIGRISSTFFFLTLSLRHPNHNSNQSSV